MISMLVGLNPMSMEEALPRLRRKSPAVVRSTRESETWTITRVLRMRERLALVHGKLDVESSPAAGTTLFVSIPLGRVPLGPGQEVL